MRCSRILILFLVVLAMIGICENAFCTAYAETSQILNTSVSGTWAYINSIEKYEAWVLNQEPSTLLLTRSEIESFGEFTQFSYFYMFDDGRATHWSYEILTKDASPLTIALYPGNSEETYIIPTYNNNRQVQSIPLEDWYAADGIDGFPQGEYNIAGIYYANGYAKYCYQITWFVDDVCFRIGFPGRNANGNNSAIEERFINPKTAGQAIDEFLEMIGLPAESFAEKTTLACDLWDVIPWVLGGIGLLWIAIFIPVRKRNKKRLCAGESTQQTDCDG